MKKISFRLNRLLIIAVLLLGFSLQSTLVAEMLPGSAPEIEIQLSADKTNPEKPMMGDHMHFHSIISNHTGKPIEGLVGWISLVEVDKGNEQPVDLEDWSAHKAITGSTLSPNKPIETDWPMRLIKSGDYRVVISVTDRNQNRVYTSDMLQFHVESKAVISSSRILPIALGIPLLLLGLIVFRKWTK